MAHVDIRGPLASVLKPEKTYRIRLASKDLGVKKWEYEDQNPVADTKEDSNDDSEMAKLVSTRSSGIGNATFRVVNSLSWPPKVETKMRLCRSSLPSSGASIVTNLASTHLEVSVVNTGFETITVQTRGHQNFIVPWGPFQPEPNALDDRPRIIDTSPDQAPISSLQIIKAVTKEVVRDSKQLGVCSLRNSKADTRPKMEGLITLTPGIPVIRVVDIGGKLKRLEDGQYMIRMHPIGCRWWRGEIEREEGEDGKLPARLHKGLFVPLMLESEDEVEVRVKDEKVDTST
jgi:hypothetical protein